MPNNTSNTISILSSPDTWVDQHGDYLYRCAMLRVRDAEVAQDMVQETLLAALQARHSFAGQSAERTWLVGILKHKIIDYVRRASREKPFENLERMTTADDEDASCFGDDGHWLNENAGPADWACDPRKLTENTQFWEVLRYCLERLPERSAQLFSLKEIDGVDSDEVCKVLNVTPSNLWVLLHRARSRLRECFETQWLGSRPGERSA
ncbi:MAG: sigma-70 family RNA polymerase sigma factor [Gammaproteobacteria bacterium]|nr:sigma-70 family RNA polymerase sigma factor [Gammaproteobacteria bacterium]